MINILQCSFTYDIGKYYMVLPSYQAYKTDNSEHLEKFDVK